VEDMAVEFAPWNTYASEYETEEGMDGRRGSIPRIKAMDGIARLEKQAEVVVCRSRIPLLESKLIG
jgi:hypothetical protein